MVWCEATPTHPDLNIIICGLHKRDITFYESTDSSHSKI